MVCQDSTHIPPSREPAGREGHRHSPSHVEAEERSSPSLGLIFKWENTNQDPFSSNGLNFNKIFSVAGTNAFVAFEAAAGNEAQSPTALSS